MAENIEITLPELGEDAVDKVTISAWLKNVGDEVNAGDDLLELTTDKAAFCLPAPRQGTLVETKVEPGQEIAVGDVICVFRV